MNMDHVDSAEKEASEVLHSLLSVERIEKHNNIDGQRTGSISSTSCELTHQVPQDQWHNPVFVNVIPQIDQVPEPEQQLEVDQVLWEGHTVQVDEAGNFCQTLTPQEVFPDGIQLEGHEKTIIIEEIGQAKVKPGVKKKCMKSTEVPYSPESSVLEDDAQQVRERFDKGCECREENCFKGLSPENVYRHRLNIAELTKAEHDMYLMGVTMAVLTNPEETVRRKERRRLRAQYVFQGRRVCLDAFLYLENCTHYQLKRIRKHVMTHGVAPRVHGNHGKKPHNTFPLDIYRQATEFLKHFIEQKSPQVVNSSSHVNTHSKSKSKPVHKNSPFYLPSEITRKTIHNAYKEFCDQCEPSLKVMGYSTFRHFMKEQFPHVKFCKVDGTSGKSSVNGFVDVEVPQQIQLHGSLVSVNDRSQSQSIITSGGEVRQMTAIPLVLSHERAGPLQGSDQTTYIVTPLTQMSSVGGESQSYTQYQLTPAPPNYALHQGTITMANAQGGTYAFTTL